jgi:hypothetical protein
VFTTFSHRKLSEIRRKLAFHRLIVHWWYSRIHPITFSSRTSFGILLHYIRLFMYRTLWSEPRINRSTQWLEKCLWKRKSKNGVASIIYYTYHLTKKWRTNSIKKTMFFFINSVIETILTTMKLGSQTFLRIALYCVV